MIQGSLLGVPADLSSSDEYYTPAWVFEAMGLRFDVDVAAPPGGVPWVPADSFFTAEDDGLAQDWHGRVWMNPPYSSATPWVSRFVAHGSGIALLPLVDSNWIDVAWTAVDAVALLPRDMPFVRPGRKDGRIMFRTALWAVGAECVEAIGRLGKVR